MDPWSLVFAVVLLVASYAITASTARKPENAKPAVLGDFDFPQSEEGTPQAVVFGDAWIGDWMVLWYGDYQIQAIVSKTGKK